MTTIKYATIGHVRGTDDIMIARGKKRGKIGYRPNDDDDVFGDPIYAEEVVELPEPMTPTEYKEYMDVDSMGEVAPIAEGILKVADENDIDTSNYGWADE